MLFMFKYFRSSVRGVRYFTREAQCICLFVFERLLVCMEADGLVGHHCTDI